MYKTIQTTISLLLLQILALQATAQGVFSDNFANNLAQWQNTTDYTIVNGQLKHNTTVAGTSYIVAAADMRDSVSWEFFFQMDFSPSAANYAQITLQSDAQNVTGSFNGYYIKMGESNGDTIKLYKKTGATSVLLGRAATPLQTAAPVKARVKITRNAIGQWVLWADYTGGTTYVSPELTVIDNTFRTGTYFGISNTHTLTNAGKFFYDDVRIAPIFIDNTPPVLQSATAISANAVDVLFDEPLQAASANTIANYTINNSVNVQSATLDAANNKLVHLVVSNLTSGTTYNLTTNNINDINNNVSAAQNKSFLFVNVELAAQYDVLINEMMVDETPVVGLPAAEFVELYNKSNKYINANTLRLKLGSNAWQTLPNAVLPPNSYTIITKNGNEQLFNNFGNVLGIASFSLTNTGATLILKGTDSTLIHQVAYTDAWYNDNAKNDGGWTLELKNPSQPCLTASNWSASNASVGGTPAMQNSIYNNNIDNQAPTLVNATALSPNTLEVKFSEAVLGLNVANMSVNNGINNPSTIVATNETTFVLTFATNFPTNTTLTLTVSSMLDCSGNNGSGNVTFQYNPTVAAERYDILINEIFVDPSNSLGIPAQEYAELYNRSTKYIQLQGMQLVSGSTSCTLPFYVLQPNTYIIVTNTQGADFSSYGTTFAISSFPALSNPTATTGDDLRLITTAGATIDALQYDKTWWKGNATTKSLERVNPSHPCEGADNWKASTNLQGGTPGAINSTYQNIPDVQAPKIVRTIVLSPTQVRIIFDEAVGNLDATMFSVDNNIGTPSNVLVGGPYFTSATLTFAQPLQNSIIYTITLNNNVKDCLGNALQGNITAKVVVPEVPAAKDIVINEILHHPKSGDAQFIELYNRSKKVIDLNSFIIAARSTDTTERLPFNYLLFPDDYVVLTENSFLLQKNHSVPNPEKVIQMPLPQLSFDGDSFFLLSNGVLVDSIGYTKDWHTALLGTDGEIGVSLERINPNGYTNDANNWHSAAQSVGFCTPTYKNSQYSAVQSPIDAEISVEPAIFSPDGDGYNDFTTISFKDGNPGYVVTAQIFDAQGRLITNLAKTQLVGTNDILQWDGALANGSKAPIGIYILYVEMFNPSGDVKKVKKAVTVAGKL